MCKATGDKIKKIFSGQRAFVEHAPNLNQSRANLILRIHKARLKCEMGRNCSGVPIAMVTHSRSDK